VSLTAASLAGEPARAEEPLDPEQVALAERGELGVDLSGSRVTIVAPDRSGLLWRWAAVLALHRLEIRSARAESLPSPAGPMAVTVFDAAPRFGSLPDVDALRTDVRRAYDDPQPLAAQLAQREQAYAVDLPAPAAPPDVLWFDDASHTATVVEVRAHDVIGLLYRLTRVLANYDLDVRSARIHTLGAEVVDTFYVVDARGNPVTDPQARHRLESDLIAACQSS
jgi:[protein-PII] uridylyltransferase